MTTLLTGQRPRPPLFPRRRLLAAAAAAPLALGAGPAAADPPAGPPRSLDLHNLHTGERFTGEYHDGSRYLLDALAALDWLLRDHREDRAAIIDMDLFDLVFALDQRYRRARGHRPTFQIHSGYRTERTNQALLAEGAAVNSYHLRGRAIDLSVAGYGIHILANFAQAAQLAGGLGIYWRGRFVHLDTGPRRFWYRR